VDKYNKTQSAVSISMADEADQGRTVVFHHYSFSLSSLRRYWRSSISNYEYSLL